MEYDGIFKGIFMDAPFGNQIWQLGNPPGLAMEV